MLPTLLALLLGAAAPEVSVTLHPAEQGAWSLRYQLSEPVPALVFARGNGDNRSETWEITTPGIALERLGATDRLVAADGSPFATVELQISGRGRKPSKDYSPFLAFTDGAAAVYTGQFIVGYPLSDDPADFVDGADNDNARWPVASTITIDRGPFARIVANARVLRSPAALPLEKGQYVYLGDTAPLETDSLTMIMDSGAPAWLVEHLGTILADTFAYFTIRFGPLPNGKPFMLTTFRELEDDALSMSGGVIVDQLAIEMGLGAGIEDTPAERLFLARFFAHESAHLWNNGRVHYDVPGDSWIHEGGAEALAWLALLDLGHDTADGVASRFSEAAGRCAAFLVEGPLNEAHRRDEFGAFYTCGAVIALATHGAMRAHQKDLAAFWRHLIERAEAGGGRYGAATYGEVLGVYSPTLADRVMRFVAVPHADAGAAIQRVLEAGGVAVALDDGELRIPALPGARGRAPAP